MRGLLCLVLVMTPVMLLAQEGTVSAREKAGEAIDETQGRAKAKAALLCERAVRWKKLRRPDIAIGTYRDAIALDPGYFPARLELAKTLWAIGEGEEALLEASRALEVAVAPADCASAHMLRSKILSDKGEWNAAQSSAEDAFAAYSDHTNIEWYLQRAYIACRLGKFEACLRGLEQGRIKTGSIVLYIQWLEVLIDAGFGERALNEIDLQIRRTRLKGHWLVRRARALRELGREKEAVPGLKAAITELNDRIDAERAHPDISLYIDRGMGLAMLGEREKARLDYVAAKEAGAEARTLWRLKAMLDEDVRITK